MTKIKLSTASYKGARDFPPAEQQKFNFIVDGWKRTARQFGYQEYGLPLLEPIEVYAAKSGEELVNQQTYAFTDRGGRQVAIRPEMTPSVSRLVAQQKNNFTFPVRLFSVANFMRYERPQKGREREFWQLNIDIFGDDTSLADLELATLAYEMMAQTGAKPEMFKIRLNDRKLIDAVLIGKMGLESEVAYRLTKLLDQKDKIAPEEFKKGLEEFCPATEDQTFLLELLNFNEPGQLPPALADFPEAQTLVQVLAQLPKLGITNAEFDFGLMRGLDYYTGLVLEVFDTNPANPRSLGGGGRYDGLVGLFGVEPVVAVGMAFGLSTFWNFMEGHGLLPEQQANPTVAILALDGQILPAVQLAQKLRQAGIAAEVDGSERKLDKRLKAITKKRINHAVFVGEKEVESGKFTLRNLADSKQDQLLPDEIVASLQ